METKKHFRGGCLNCPQTEDLLPLSTILYQGFGGYCVNKNGKLYYEAEQSDEWEDFKTLNEIEKEVKKDENAKWEVVLDNPLRGATWERNKKGRWILTKTNKGFA